MKKLLTITLAVMLSTVLYAQNFNLTLRSTIPYGVSLSNIGGFVDSQGNEYALVGYFEGLDIVDVTDPDNPVVKFTVPGPQSDWREVKTWGNYAYVTTEGGNSGLQIIDMSNLPASINSKFWKGSGSINNQIETIHALHIEDAHVYLFGSNLFNGAALIASLNDPWNPVYLGRTPGSYIHDGYVRNDVLYAGHIYDGYFAVYDVTNKAQPVLLAQQNTPGNFTHNTWLNDAGNVLLTTDEVNNSYLTAYDISDLGDIQEIARYQTTPGSGSIGHNTHVINDYAVTSWYKDGVSITDVSRPDNIVSVGFYDTYPQGTGGGFSGCWGVYPFLPSGTIVASDINNGLFVLTPTYTRACYLEGVVTDSVSGLPLNNATVTIIGANITKNTNVQGEYKTGTVTPGTVSVQVTRAGYISKTINNVVLNNGQLTVVDVQLTAISAFTLTGQVIDGVTGQPVAGALVELFNSGSDDLLTTDANGNFALPSFFPDSYSIDAGKWGYRTYCSDNVAVDPSTVPLTIVLQPGIYDDFTFDLGWTVSGISPNAWERGEPVGTTLFGAQSNPDVDVNNDCRDKAYVTDNGGGQAGSNDVDNGNTILTSPVFDASQFLNPYVNYYRWFFNAGGQGNPNDTLTVKLFNGTTTVTLETVLPNTPNGGSWVSRSFQIGALITPSSTMQFIIETADWPGPGGHIVEGALDKFEVVEGPASLNENASPSVSVFPNPSSDAFSLSFDAALFGSGAALIITDISGRIIFTADAAEINNSTFGSSLSAGIYIAQVVSEKVKSAPLRISKVK
jgi:choice-of-anchor B domain-containing protein